LVSLLVIHSQYLIQLSGTSIMLWFEGISANCDDSIFRNIPLYNNSEKDWISFIRGWIYSTSGKYQDFSLLGLVII
jgi:hypothetical protein